MKLLAVSALAIRQTLHQKIYYVIIILILGMTLVGLNLPSVNLESAKIKVALSMAIGAISVLGTILAVFLPALALPVDIQRKRVFSILSKPIGKVQFLLGYFFGFAVVMGLTVFLLGSVLLGILGFITTHAPGQSLEARRPLYSTTPATTDWRANAVKEYTWDFEGLKASDFPEDIIQVRLNLFVVTGVLGVDIWSYRLEVPDPVHPWQKEVDLVRDVEKVVLIPAEVLKKTPKIKLIGSAPRGRFLPDPNGVSLLKHPELFAYTFYKALFVVFLEVLLVLAASVGGSAILSTPVTVFWGLSLVFFGNVVDFVRGALEFFLKPTGHHHHHDMPLSEMGEKFSGIGETLNHFAYSLSNVFCKICPDFTNFFNTTEYMDRGMAIPWQYLARGFGYALPYMCLFLAVGIFAFHRREFN